MIQDIRKKNEELEQPRYAALRSAIDEQCIREGLYVHHALDPEFFLYKGFHRKPPRKLMSYTKGTMVDGIEV